MQPGTHRQTVRLPGVVGATLATREGLLVASAGRPGAAEWAELRSARWELAPGTSTRRTGRWKGLKRITRPGGSLAKSTWTASGKLRRDLSCTRRLPSSCLFITRES